MESMFDLDVLNESPIRIRYGTPTDSPLEAKERLELAMETGEYGFWDWNLDNNEIYFSPHFFSMLGYTAEDLCNGKNPWIDMLHPDDKNTVLPAMRKLILYGEPYRVEIRMLNKNGVWKWISSKAKSFDPDEQGQAHRLLGVHVDIDEAKNAVGMLQQERHHLQILLENIEAQIWFLQDERTYGAVNRAHAQFNGMSTEEMSFKSMSDLFPMEVVKCCYESNRQVFSTKKEVVTEEWMASPSGEQRLLSIRKIPVLNATGEIDYVVCSGADITDRNRVEEKLRNSEKNFRTFFETMDDMIFIANQQGQIYYTNSAVSRKLGYSTDELLEMSVLDAHAPDYRAEAEAIYRAMFDGTRDTCPLPLGGKDGSIVPVETKIWFGEWDGKDSIFAISKDLSREQSALQKFNKLFDRNPALMAVSSLPDRRMTEVNEAFIKKLGYSRDEILGKISTELKIFVDLEQQKNIEEKLLNEGRVEGCNIAVKAKNGSVLYGIMSGEVVESQGRHSLLTVMTDVTDQRRSEDALKEANKNLQEQTSLAKEMAAQAEMANKAKSDFLAHMSHEIRTPMNAVVGFTDLLLSSKLSDIQRQYLENVCVSAEALLGVINDILDFSKIEAGRLELDYSSVDLREILEKVMDVVMFKAHKKGLELVLDIDNDLPQLVRTDSVRLNQIVTNLVSNAVKFTEAGEVRLQAKCEDRAENGTITISVYDTGIGMSEEQQKRIFQSFTQADHSTTRKYGGSGLGLSIAQSLVEKMGGVLHLASVPGEGSIFSFTLDFEVEKENMPISSEPMNIGKVLIVDDNLNTRGTLEAMCSHWGIKAESAATGLEALEKLRGKGPFDVVLLDYHMPFMNGFDVAEKICTEIKQDRERPALILLYNSVDEPRALMRCDEFPIEHKLVKPIKMQQLKDLFQQVQQLRSPQTNHAQFKPRSSPRLIKEFEGSITILVAEDNPPNLLLARSLLSKIVPNALMIEAQNGRLAVQKYLEHKPDLILMDVQMPVLDGYSAAREIRELERKGNKHTPIIALTAGALKGDREKCLAAGMDDYLSKPIMIGDLREKILHRLHASSHVVQFSPPDASEKQHNPVVAVKSFLLTQGHDEATISELLDMLEERIPELVEKVRLSLVSGNKEGLRAAAHSIKGIAGALGLREAALYAEKTEQCTLTEGIEKATVHANALMRECEYCMDLLLSQPRKKPEDRAQSEFIGSI